MLKFNWRVCVALISLALGFVAPTQGRADPKVAKSMPAAARLTKCAAVATLNGTARSLNGSYIDSYPTAFGNGVMLELIDRDPKLRSLENRGYVLSRLFGTGRARSTSVDTARREISTAENDYAPTLLRDHAALVVAVKDCASEATNVAATVDYRAELAKIGARLDGYIGDYRNIAYDDVCATRRTSKQANSYVAGMPDDYCKRARLGGPLDAALKGGKARDDDPVPFDPQLDSQAPTATPTNATTPPCPPGMISSTQAASPTAASGSQRGTLSKFKDSVVGKTLERKLPSWLRSGAATIDEAQSKANQQTALPQNQGCVRRIIRKTTVASSRLSTLEKFTDGLMVLFVVVQPEGPGEIVDEAILVRRAALARELENSGEIVADLDLSPKIRDQMGARGWTEEEMFQLREDESTGTSVDRTNGQNDPATVYGDKNGYMVVNDRTNNVAAISDKNDPEWRVDKQIKWRK